VASLLYCGGFAATFISCTVASLTWQCICLVFVPCHSVTKLHMQSVIALLCSNVWLCVLVLGMHRALVLHIFWKHIYILCCSACICIICVVLIWSP